MARRRPASSAAADAAAHLHRSTAWHGLRAGDPVVVAGLRERSATWEFLAHVRNERNGAESIEVVGGRPGDRTVRSFDPGRIYPATARRGRDGTVAAGQLSLADAPQLPLD
ncbi:MAG: hypothetical protein ACLQOZ_08600 [Acidimicrobiales bacterium]